MPTGSPFPDLQIQPLSGLSFPWAFKEVSGQSSFDAELGPEGIGLGAIIEIDWEDLNTAVTELLGYSYRDVQKGESRSGSIDGISGNGPIDISTGSPHNLHDGDEVVIEGVGGCTDLNEEEWGVTVLDPTHFEIDATCNAPYSGGGTWTAYTSDSVRLRRVLPWQHPFWNQLYVRKITKVQGVRQSGKNFNAFDLSSISLGSVGPGYKPNYGPYTGYDLAYLTLAFWRPPYYVRTDDDILDQDGEPQEWLRYVSRPWSGETEMLSREAGAFAWSPGQGAVSNTGAPVPGSIGQIVSHDKIDVRWHQLPALAVFSLIEQYGVPYGIPTNLVKTQTPTTNPVNQNYTYLAGNPIRGCVNSPFGGGVDDFDVDGTDLRFFGFDMGTLRLDSVTVVEQQLHLPPYLMMIPTLSANEPVAQLQYDVVFHFDYFDPPRAPQIQGNPFFRGHNLLPWSGDGAWYMMQSQASVGGANVPTTQFNYADFHDLFKIL